MPPSGVARIMRKSMRKSLRKCLHDSRRGPGLVRCASLSDCPRGVMRNSRNHLRNRHFHQNREIEATFGPFFWLVGPDVGGVGVGSGPIGPGEPPSARSRSSPDSE